MGKTEENKPLESPEHKDDNNIKEILKKQDMGRLGLDWPG